MKRTGRVLLPFLLALAFHQPLTAGETCMLDIAPAAATAGLSYGADGALDEQGGRLIYLLGQGQVLAYPWLPPILGDPEGLGKDIGRVVAMPAENGSQWLLLVASDGQGYQLWRLSGPDWSQAASGSFGGRILAAAGGHFVSGEKAGLFLQFDNGRLSYWQVEPGGCTPVWQSPDPWPVVTAVRNADLDGDGQDEIVAVNANGAVSILRWRNGLWESTWNLPPWGQVLGIDVCQADDQPGLEVAVITSQRRLFLIGSSSGSFAVKLRLTTGMVAANVGLVPQGGGAVVLADAVGDLYLFLPEAASWRLEAHLGGGERLSFLAGMSPEYLLAGTAGGGLRVIHALPLGRLSVFLDGQEAKNAGLYWTEGDFYFNPDFLQRVVGVSTRWDAKKGRLTLTAGNTVVAMETGKDSITINGRPWPMGRALILSGKVPFVPADLLRGVFLINVTYDPGSESLILTSSSPEAA